uniref:EEF1A lysine methyltransferase 2 n=1 Tax=Sinocyclocheilus rhinocerous TaxID=307959 RepID=A0A673LQT7_9TELE
IRPYLILELEMGCSLWNWHVKAKHGFSNLTGIDYSKAAVELTVNILEEEVADFLNPSAELKGFDACIDKGTFDAISLSPEDREEAKKCYVNSLKTVVQPGGFFIITSCNWTKEQLLQIFRAGTLTYWHIS